MTPNDEGSNGLQERVRNLLTEVADLRRWRVTQETALTRTTTELRVTREEVERMRAKLEGLERTAQRLALGVAESKAKLAALVVIVTTVGSVLGNLLIQLLR